MAKLIVCLIAFYGLMLEAVYATELNVSIRVQDISVGNVVVYLEPAIELPSDFVYQSGIPPEMSQQDREFLPHILPIYKNSQVLFPNRDSISHHVFSFSPAKVFELELYKERSHAPVIFDKTGIVTIGCNIHDWMLSYILVLDTPIFQKTNDQGVAQFRDVPSGEYRLKIWHPQLSSDDREHNQAIKLTTSKAIEITLKQPLKNAIEQRTGFEDEEY